MVATTSDTRGDLGRYVAGRERVLGDGSTLTDLAKLVETHVPYWHDDAGCPLCGRWRDRLSTAVAD